MAAWETEPSYFLPVVYAIPGSISTVFYNLILCDIFYSVVS